MEPMTMMALASLANAGIGALGNIFSGDGQQAGGGVTPSEIMNMPTYAHQGPTLEAGANFVQGGLKDLTAGKLPAWWEQFQQTVRQGMERGVENAFYGATGLGGARGIFDQIRGTGAATGAGPKNTIANTNKALQSYADKYREVGEYLAGQSLTFGQSMAEKLSWMAAQIGSISPPAQVVGGQPYSTPAQANPWSSSLDVLSKAMPFLTSTMSKGTGLYDYTVDGGVGGDPWTQTEISRMPNYAQQQFSQIPTTGYSNYLS